MTVADLPDVRDWFDRGLVIGAEYLIVMHDAFDHEDYPVYVWPWGDVRARVRGGDTPVEVYHLGSNREYQLNEARARHETPIEGRPLEPEYDARRTRVTWAQEGPEGPEGPVSGTRLVPTPALDGYVVEYRDGLDAQAWVREAGWVVQRPGADRPWIAVAYESADRAREVLLAVVGPKLS